MGRPRWLTWAFSRPWRDRYGAELVDLLDDMIAEGQVPVRDRLDLVTAGVSERLRRVWSSLVGWRRAVVSASLVAGVAAAVAVTAVVTVRTGLRVHATIRHAGVANPYEGTCNPSAACTLTPATDSGTGTLTVTLDPETGMVIAIEGASLPSEPFTLSGTIPGGRSP